MFDRAPLIGIASIAAVIVGFAAVIAGFAAVTAAFTPPGGAWSPAHRIRSARSSRGAVELAAPRDAA